MFRKILLFRFTVFRFCWWCRRTIFSNTCNFISTSVHCNVQHSACSAAAAFILTVEQPHNSRLRCTRLGWNAYLSSTKDMRHSNFIKILPQFRLNLFVIFMVTSGVPFLRKWGKKSPTVRWLVLNRVFCLLNLCRSIDFPGTHWTPLKIDYST